MYLGPRCCLQDFLTIFFIITVANSEISTKIFIFTNSQTSRNIINYLYLHELSCSRVAVGQMGCGSIYSGLGKSCLLMSVK